MLVAPATYLSAVRGSNCPLQGTNDILRLFIALTGIQTAGAELKGLQKALNSPLSNLGLVVSEVCLHDCSQLWMCVTVNCPEKLRIVASSYCCCLLWGGQGIGMVRAKAGFPVLPDMSWVPAPLATSGEIAASCTASFGHVRTWNCVRAAFPHGAQRRCVGHCSSPNCHLPSHSGCS